MELHSRTAQRNRAAKTHSTVHEHMIVREATPADLDHTVHVLVSSFLAGMRQHLAD